MLDIDARCQARLREVLEEALRVVKLTGGMFLDPRSTLPVIVANSVLPKTGPVRSRINEIFDDLGFAEFVLGSLQLELDEQQRTYERGSEFLLTDTAGFTDAQAVASRLVSEFNSLPWQYCVTIRLPDSLSSLFPSDQAKLELSASLRLVRSNKDLRTEYPLASDSNAKNQRMHGYLTGLLFLSGPPEWAENGLYIQIECSGFIGQYAGTKAAHAAERDVKSLLGMGLATGLLSSGLLPYASPRLHAFVHRRMPNGSWLPITRYDLSEGMSQGLSRLSVGVNGSPTERPLLLHRGIRLMADAFGSTGGERVLSASQWHFDSHTRLDPLLAFVQAMVVLEIMFGEDEHSGKIGVMEVLASRFAYFVGTSSEERTQLMARFRDIYRVRSQIVHVGKTRLSGQEQTLFFELQIMGGRAIAKELELLQAAAVRSRRDSLVRALACRPED